MGSITPGALVVLLAATGDVVIDGIEGWDAPDEGLAGDTLAKDPPHTWSAVWESLGNGMEHMRARTLRDISFTMLGHGGGPAEMLFEDLVGDVVLVHVWATWCAPCRKKMPAFEVMQETYRDKGLAVLNVSDEPAEVLLGWLDKNPSAMLHGQRDDMRFLVGPEADPGAGVARPVYLVLDRVGVVREAWVGAVGAGPEGADAGVRHLTVLVERYL